MPKNYISRELDMSDDQANKKAGAKGIVTVESDLKSSSEITDNKHGQ